MDRGARGSEAAEQQRRLVNTWIRTSGAFDAVIDFDSLLRGYRAMGSAVSLSLFP